MAEALGSGGGASGDGARGSGAAGKLRASGRVPAALLPRWADTLDPKDAGEGLCPGVGAGDGSALRLRWREVACRWRPPGDAGDDADTRRSARDRLRMRAGDASAAAAAARRDGDDEEEDTRKDGERSAEAGTEPAAESLCVPEAKSVPAERELQPDREPLPAERPSEPSRDARPAVWKPALQRAPACELEAPPELEPDADPSTVSGGSCAGEAQPSRLLTTAARPDACRSGTEVPSLRKRAATSTERRAARRGSCGEGALSAPTAVAKSSSATTGIPASVTSSADAELFGDAGCCSQAADGANPLAAESRVPGAWPDEGAAAATVAGLLRQGAFAVGGAASWSERSREETLTRRPGVTGSGPMAWPGTSSRPAPARVDASDWEYTAALASDPRGRFSGARGRVREPQLDTLEGPLGRGEEAPTRPPTRDGGAEARARADDRLGLDRGGVRCAD